MENISFILGAGFSKAAGYPLCNEINDKIINGVANFSFRTNEGTWKWIEKNGIRNPRYNYPSYDSDEPLLLDAFIELYQSEMLLPFNYEEFYDWFYEVKEHEVREGKEDTLSKVRKICTGLQESEDVLDNYSKLNSCFQFLLQDLLAIEDEKLELYSYLNSFLIKNINVNFFTLNHDILLENLLDSWGLEFSDGFTKQHDTFKYRGEPVSTFKNDFQKDLKIFKLHGSVDYYRRPQKDIEIEDFMIKSRDLRERLYTKSSQNQDFILDLTKDRLAPEFLTGKRKFDSQNQKEPKCFINLFEHYQTKLPQSTLIIIIGYSYMDKHINGVIKNAIDTNSEIRIININPFQKFPFKRNATQKNIENLKYPDELLNFI